MTITDAFLYQTCSDELVGADIDHHKKRIIIIILESALHCSKESIPNWHPLQLTTCMVSDMWWLLPDAFVLECPSVSYSVINLSMLCKPSFVLGTDQKIKYIRHSVRHVTWANLLQVTADASNNLLLLSRPESQLSNRFGQTFCADITCTFFALTCLKQCFYLWTSTQIPGIQT